MRNTTMCDVQLNPSTETNSFERSVVDDVFPHAGDRPREADALFVRSLYQARTDEFPPSYVCLVDSLFAGDSDFFGMRRPLTELGAAVSRPPRYWPLIASLPDVETATAEEPPALAPAAGSTLPDLLMVLLRLPLDRNQKRFEEVLDRALSAEIARGSTRTNGVTSVRWFRDDESAIGAIEYLCKATGYFMRPRLFGDTEKRIEQAGAEIVRSASYSHIGTVSGGAFPPEVTVTEVTAPTSHGRGS
jgi:hypothetical protein